jgi:class 3 adenylate cyclase/pimeloyl-ACP methyl ester carboxylesterase
MAEREVRYCTTEDGVRIAYCVEGGGPPLLVVPGFIASFSQSYSVPGFDELMREVGRRRQLVHYDLRGTGLSQLEVSDLSPAATVRDVEAVVKALGLRRLSLWGAGMGGPRAIAYAAGHPRQVDKLILSGTFARLLDVFPRETLESFAHLARANWELASRTFADLGIRRRSEQEGLRWAEWYRKSITGEAMARFIEQHVDLDVTRLLGRVRCPVLILHNLETRGVYPFALGQRLAEAIPNARLVPAEGEGSGILESLPGIDAVDVLEAFLSDDRSRTMGRPAMASGAFRTVLFTDLVGHAEMMQRLGDEKGRDVLREHERITRETLAQHGGAEVKTMGDGFLASFGSVTRAMDCAIALQRAFATHTESMPEPLHVRVGLNAGEPIEEDGDLFGSTVILASRIAAQAGAGEILIPEPLRHLLSGKSYVYSDRGETALKGFEDAVRLYEVRWRDDA